MRVYQGLWDNNGHFLLFGEKASSFQDVITRADAGDYDSTEIIDHPYACSAEQISADLNEIEFAADEFLVSSVLLPTDSLGPCSSPGLIAGREIEREAQPFLKPWLVPMASFDPYAAACLLTSLPSSEIVSIRFDASVKYWLEVTKFILELLCRGRFLPNLICSPNMLESVWQAIPNSSEDMEKLRLLTKAMPPICCMFPSKEGERLVSPDALVESFINNVTDALIRVFLKNHPLVEDEKLPAYCSDRNRTAKIWLRSLTAQSRSIEVEGNELLMLAERLKLWSSRLLSGIKRADLHLAFQVSAASEEQLVENKTNQTNSDHWLIKFFLYVHDDIKQRLYPYQIWNGNISFLKNTEYTPEQVEEIFLKELGRASTIIPELKSALFSSHPSFLRLTTPQVYEFLRQKVTLLEQADFQVLLPDWWKRPQTQFGLQLAVSPRPEDEQMSVGINQLLNCSWRIVVGDNSLSLEEFKNLVRDSHLLKVGTDWIEVNPEKLAATSAFIETKELSGQMTILDALRLGYGVSTNTQILPVVDFVSSGWVKQLMDSAAQGLPHLEQPSGFRGELRHYQQDGLSWMAFLANLGIGFCLADDMGLGKTIQFIALLLHEKMFYAARKDEKINLLIVPMSILDNWERELSHFAPEISVYLHHGASRLSDDDFFAHCAQVDLVITTYNIAYRDSDLLSKIRWARIALDEAQNIKNLATKQTQSIRKLIQEQLNDKERSTICQRLALTGTPLENHLDELWSIMDFLNPGYLGSLRNFRSLYSIPIERYKSREAATALSHVVRPFILRRLKSDPQIISDLPEKLEMVENIHLTAEQLQLYQKIFEDMLPRIERAEGIHRKGLVLTTIVRLKQICNHPNLVKGHEGDINNRSGKLTRLVELLETILNAGDKVLIFTQFAQMGHILKSFLQERFSQDVLFLHGGLTKNARVALVDRFQRPEGPGIFILSLKAGGFGLNLTEANQVIHFDQWWNPAVENQATDRAYRIGQKRNVQVRKFICRGTLEEKIAALLQEKQALADNIVSSTRNDIIQLSADELKDLLKLTHETLVLDNE